LELDSDPGFDDWKLRSRATDEDVGWASHGVMAYDFADV